MKLDDRIYCLQQTTLPDHLMAKLVDADVAYLQDRDSQSERLVSELEAQCKAEGILIYKPRFALA